jgi:hypothetical protein
VGARCAQVDAGSVIAIVFIMLGFYLIFTARARAFTRSCACVAAPHCAARAPAA